MARIIEKTLWVEAVQPEVIDGQKYIPTALCYTENDGLVFGSKAMALREGGRVVNSEFKVALGEVVSGGSKENRREFEVDVGEPRNAYNLAKDYFDNVLKHVEDRFPRSEATNYKHPAKIIVAEPLSFQMDGYSPRWVSNYRDNIRRILDRYEEVEFLPEPFAVFQYYRYGCRVPILQDASKHVAFIVDFGGGTFDACVIESTNKGDISLSGKSSKPLAADSVPVGGFVVNREIATFLIKLNLDNGKRKEADRYIAQYQRVLIGELKLEDLGVKNRSFIENYKKLEASAEGFKIELSSKISNWRLDSDAYEKVMVDVPADPFASSGFVKIEFYAHQLRTVFVNEVWNKKLKKTISNVLDRSSEALNDREISVTLISGGSSNLKWLQELLVKDFSDQLENAEPVPISHSFQEVVANGLAIECARRYYDTDSEFVAVTYNPIKLFLNPDDTGLVKDKKFRSVGEKIDMGKAGPADLVPSAQSLKHFFESELQWKIKLSKSPKHHLDYYFSRPDSDDDLDSYNVEEVRVNTRDSKHFDSAITVQIVVREDGTVTPKFIYKVANAEFGAEENSVTGRSFHIDMTADANEIKSGDHFVGFDFGTSNSSLCVLDSNKIKVTTRRQQSSAWSGLSACISQLPFPVAFAVRNFLGTTQARDIPVAAREAFESCLAFMAYTAASEASLSGPIDKLMRGFQHRSMGPLKAMLESSLKIVGSKARFSSGFGDLFSPENSVKLNKAVYDFNEHKHDKLGERDADWQEYVELVVRVCSKAMENKLFGYSAECSSVPFSVDSYEGLFKVANDNAPFIKSFAYTSGQSVSDSYALLYDKSSGEALCLSPFIFWFHRMHTSAPHGCFWLDKREDGVAIVKPCDEKTSIKSSEVHTSLSHVFDALYDNGVLLSGPIAVDFALDEDTSRDF
ncbi:hypothetical protein BXT89_03260 [Halopseudomonas pachastrellae]|uniref:Uncharacterized protein n=1 Tax=Halopseudomonas pachastrellae TaxID=254161 RepID=A0A1S8DLH0_9GAMM|nr:hypothetical protein [Halopseudomonas pachastrellae]ONM45217.1 hypothetical protein BXT89_03260 [Halopseudomonas pachastrellae]SFM50685.1 hypothetical protein SAMN05216256_113102 [Halopseudomonas pachastrellae]